VAAPAAAQGVSGGKAAPAVATSSLENPALAAASPPGVDLLSGLTSMFTFTPAVRGACVFPPAVSSPEQSNARCACYALTLPA